MGNILHEYIGLFIAVAIVLIVIVLQIISFVKTKKKIVELQDLFGGVDDLLLKETSIKPHILREKLSLQKFLQKIPSRYNDEDGNNGDDYMDLSLIVFQNEKYICERLKLIIHRTNEYLCKNMGTSADLEVLEDICNNQKRALEDDIHNSLNVPLYL